MGVREAFRRPVADSATTRSKLSFTPEEASQRLIADAATTLGSIRREEKGPKRKSVKKQKTMSQKYVKKQNTNSKSTAYGKYYAKAVYDENFVGIDEIADYIQQQASVKKSDVKAAIGELGEALKHYMEMGQKVRLDGIGIFKVGFSAIGVDNPEDCTAATITTRRIIFTPETQRLVVGSTRADDGGVKQKYVVAKTLVMDVAFEEAHLNAGFSSSGSSAGSGSTGGNTGSGGSTGGNTGGNTGGGGDGPQI